VIDHNALSGADAAGDKNTSVFLPENRFKTNRSLLRFRKP